MPSSTGVSRRRVLALAGSGVLTGCLGRRDTPSTPTARESADPTPAAADTATPGGTGTHTETETPHSAREPSFESGDAAWASPARPARGTWPLARYDAGGTHSAPATQAPSSFPLERVWEHRFEGSNVRSPIAGGDGLYLVVTGDGDAPTTTLARLEPGSGESVWQTESEHAVQTPAALDGGDLFVTLGSSAVGAFATSDGTSRTLRVPTARFDRQMLVSGSVLYVTDDRDDLSAFDAASGERCFRFDAGGIDVDAPVAEDLQTWTPTSLAVDTDRVYVATAAHYNDQLPPDLGRVFALDPPAEGIAWSARLAPDTPTRPTPAREVVVRDGTVYVASERAVYALDASDGRHLWTSGQFPERLWTGQLTVTPDSVAVATPSAVRALDATTGDVRWSIDVPRPRGIAAAGDRLFLASVPSDGQPTALALDSEGETLWRREFDVGIGTLTPAHGRLYADTNDGRVLAFA